MDTRVAQPSVGEPSQTTGMVWTALVMVGPEATSVCRREDQRVRALGQVVVDRSQRLL